MTNRFEWTWQWEANRISLWDIDPSVLLAELEVKIRNQLALRPEITKVESVRFSNVKHWTEVGINRRYSGKAVTIFYTDPIGIDDVIAILAIIIPLIIAAIWAFIVWTVASVVREIAGGAGGLGGIFLLGVIAFGLYVYWKTGERK